MCNERCNFLMFQSRLTHSNLSNFSWDAQPWSRITSEQTAAHCTPQLLFFSSFMSNEPIYSESNYVSHRNTSYCGTQESVGVSSDDGTAAAWQFYKGFNSCGVVGMRTVSVRVSLMIYFTYVWG